MKRQKGAFECAFECAYNALQYSALFAVYCIKVDWKKVHCIVVSIVTCSAVHCGVRGFQHIECNGKMCIAMHKGGGQGPPPSQ